MKRRMLLIISVLVILLLPPSINGKIIVEEIRYISEESNTSWSYSAPQSNFNITIELSVLNGTNTITVLILNNQDYYDFMSGENFTAIYEESGVINTYIQLTLESTAQTFIVVQNQNNEGIYVEFFLEDLSPESSEPLTIYQPIYSGEISILVGIIIGIIVFTSFLFLIIRRFNQRDNIETMKRRVSEHIKSHASIYQPSNAPAGTVKYCTNCGSEVEYQEIYCSYCGNRFET